jgi:hypothetical protein
VFWKQNFGIKKLDIFVIVVYNNKKCTETIDISTENNVKNKSADMEDRCEFWIGRINMKKKWYEIAWTSDFRKLEC